MLPPFAQPYLKMMGHNGTAIGDVQWQHIEWNILGSVGDDRCLCLWDKRDRSLLAIQNAHASDIHCLSFNRFDNYRLLTGSADGHIKLWDTRNIPFPVKKYKCHQGDVNRVSK